MSSLLALLSQQTPLQTRKGLILLGLQNDFLSPDGKLPVSKQSGYLDRLKELVPAFREFGDVIWVASEFEANRVANVDDENGDTVIAGSVVGGSSEAAQSNGSKRKASQDHSGPMKRMKAADAEDDPELFLTRTSKREPCCIKGSWGAEYPEDIKALVDKKDLQVVKTFYSAFGSTSLLLTLRSKLITELFVCGCNTNLSVFATAMDAARYGIQITLIEDCLGYRQKDRHDEAVRQLVDIMDADVISSDKVVDVLKNPPLYEDDEDDDAEEENSEGDLLGGQTAVDFTLPIASGVDVLEADSDGDEEEAELPNVRSLRLDSVGLPLRVASSLSRSSRRTVPTTEHAPTSERAKSSSARPSSSSDDVVGDRRAEAGRRASSGSGSGDNTDSIESKVTSGYGGLDHMPAHRKKSSVTDESSNGVRDTQPWLRVLERNLSAHADDASKLPPRCSHPGLAALSAVAGLDQQTVDDYEIAMQEARQRSIDSDRETPKSIPLFGEGKETESADSRILYDLLPAELAEMIFDELNREVNWQRMRHQTGEVPRLVCCQGNVAEDGSMPLYRHPSDQTLPLSAWTPMVEKVRKAAEEAVGHPLNHVLIQLYRGGTDYISEHSDKTLDVAKGSNIVNVSFGAQRTMRLRIKRGAIPAATGDDTNSTSPGRTTYRVPMPHNSMITMSLPTNAEYLHGIMADKRPAVEFTEAETAFRGQRISLTFRHIGTFLSADEKLIWGQGATSKSREDAKPVINADAAESEKLVRAFGAENQASSIDWDAVYGEGSDVLHLK